MWQKEQAVPISARNGRFWIEFHNLARDPNSHVQKLNFLNNHSHHISGYGSGPPQATVGPYAHLMYRTYVYSATTWPYSCPLCGTYSRTLVRACNKNQSIEWWRQVHLPGKSSNRLTTYHIYGMWLVLSNTWPQLPHTATLSTFINTDRVTFPVMILHMTPWSVPPIREDLKVWIYQSQEADNTFITSDDTSPYNSSR
jgi:hypothetical protein